MLMSLETDVFYAQMRDPRFQDAYLKDRWEEKQGRFSIS